MTLKDKQDAEAFKDDLYDSMPDYTKFTNGSDLLKALGDEGMKWAAAFCQTTKKRFDIDIELGYALGWFANAIEHSSDVRRWRAEAAAKEEPSVDPDEIYDDTYHYGRA
jgi:hypothetical protein